VCRRVPWNPWSHKMVSSILLTGREFHCGGMCQKKHFLDTIGRYEKIHVYDDFFFNSSQISNIVQGKAQLRDFLACVIPETLAPNASLPKDLLHIRTRDDFITDVMDGIGLAPMSIRLTPHILSLVDWSNALVDPIRKQFIPLKSSLKPDHPQLTLDSLHETRDSPVPGLVHRYPDKALFLGSLVVVSPVVVYIIKYDMFQPPQSAQFTVAFGR
jgi:lysine 2,3-aminomutase